MSLLEEVQEAVAFVQTRTALRPKVGLILGSGLGAFAETLADAATVPYREVPHFPVSTAVGHKGELVIGRSHGVPVAVMAGRVHFYEGYPMRQVVFPVRVLGRLGVEVLIVTNAAGAVNAGFRPGELMVIEDHVNLMGTNPMIGPNEDAFGPRFFDMTSPYDAELRAVAEAACRKAGVPVRKGLYYALTGPSYETAAEVRMLRGLGADAVGMSTVPEVIAARHMGLRVVGLSCISNMGAGLLDQPLDHHEVLEVGERVKAGLIEVLGHIVAEVEARSTAARDA